VTITYPLSLPTSPKPAQVQIGSTDVVGVNRSPFSNKREVQDWGGDMWSAKLTWPVLAGRDQAEPLLVMLLALRGRLGTVLIGDPLGATGRGVLTGAPLINGVASAGARNLAIKGATHSVTGWIKAGDYLQLGSGTSTRLHKALADAASDGSGNLTVDIWPRLRESYADGAAIAVSNCRGTFELGTNQRGWDESSFFRYAVEVAFVESY